MSDPVERGIAYNFGDCEVVLASDYDALAQRCLELEAGIDQLRAEVEALRQDAERYRWLRDNCQDVADEYGTAGQLYFGTYRAGRLEAGIDAAMRNEQ